MKQLLCLTLAAVAALLSGCATGGGGSTGAYKVTAFKPHNPANVKVKLSLSTQNVYVLEGVPTQPCTAMSTRSPSMT